MGTNIGLYYGQGMLLSRDVFRGRANEFISVGDLLAGFAIAEIIPMAYVVQWQNE